MPFNVTLGSIASAPSRFDVDGVLTDGGTLQWGPTRPGMEKRFHFSDIMGVSLAPQGSGIKMVTLISGEDSPR